MNSLWEAPRSGKQYQGSGEQFQRSGKQYQGPGERSQGSGEQCQASGKQSQIRGIWGKRSWPRVGLPKPGVRFRSIRQVHQIWDTYPCSRASKSSRRKVSILWGKPNKSGVSIVSLGRVHQIWGRLSFSAARPSNLG